MACGQIALKGQGDPPAEFSPHRLAKRVVRRIQEIGVLAGSAPKIQQGRTASHCVYLACGNDNLPVISSVTEQPPIPVVGRFIDRGLNRLRTIPDTKRTISKPTGLPMLERPDDGVEPFGILKQPINDGRSRTVWWRLDLVFYFLRKVPISWIGSQIIKQILRSVAGRRCFGPRPDARRPVWLRKTGNPAPDQTPRARSK